MSRPLVSIITPSYNQGAYIEQTIASIRAQRYPNIEHIVVDGGSTDQTLDILRRYDGTYDMRWLSEPDEGMYDAVNKGLRMARGEILAYLNTDDQYLPWTVHVAVAALESHPNAGFVYGDILNFKEGAPAGAIQFYPPLGLGYLRRSDFIAQPSLFWRREVYERYGGFDQSLRLMGDADYWMRMGGGFDGIKLDEVLAIERDHLAGLRFARRQEFLDEIGHVRARYADPAKLATRARRIGDRFYRMLFKRWYLLRFLIAYSLSSRRSPTARHGWSEYLAHARPRRIFWLRAAATFVPLTRGRFAESMVEFDLPYEDVARSEAHPLHGAGPSL